MTELLVEALFEMLSLLFRLLVFILTGEWPRTQDEAPAEVPTPAPASAPRKERSKVDLAELARVQRSQGTGAGTLADVDAVLEALAEPVLEHGKAQNVALAPLTFVSLFNSYSASQVEQSGALRTIYLGVENDLADRPERWVFLARNVGHAVLLHALPGFQLELQRVHRLAPSLFLPPDHDGYDPELARSALGVWLPELLADVYATYALGPAYVGQLLLALRRPKQPVETVMARALGRFLAPLPPSVLRVYAALFVLNELGFHERRSKLLESWERAHSPEDVLYLPLADGGLAGVPLSLMQASLEALLEDVLTAPSASLGRLTWLDVPGLAFLHAEQSQAEVIAQVFARGEASHAPARVLVAAAALAVEANPRLRQPVAAALQRSLRGKDTLEASPDAYSLPAKSATGHVRLGAAFRDARAVREAVLIGQAFAPIKRRASRPSRR